MEGLKVFSPSSTVTFSKCPRRWAIEKAGWKSRLIEYPELCAVLGDGFSKAMELYNTGLMRGEVHRVEQLLQVGVTTMDERLEWDLAAGRRIALDQEEFRGKLPALLEKALDLYIKVDPLQGWTILEVEKTYEEHGYARLDLLAANQDGGAVLDYKVKVKLAKDWEAKELEKHAKGWQRPHYLWMTGVKRFFIVMVVLGPKPYVKLEPYEQTTYDEKVWHFDATRIWQRMSIEKEGLFAEGASLIDVPGSASHVDEWGACPYQSACLDYALDPERMAVQYIQVERKKASDTKPPEALTL